MNIPTQVDGEMIGGGMGTVNRFSSMGPIEGMDYRKSVTSMNKAFYSGAAIDNGEGTWGTTQRRNSGFYHDFDIASGAGGGLYDGMALSDSFLREYYTQVRIQIQYKNYIILTCQYA